MHSLTGPMVERFARQLMIPSIGVQGQEKICNAKVLVVGAGGLGSPVLLYLAAAGVGHLGIVDYDTVDESNLQRQIIHTESRIGSSKVHSAAASVEAISSFVKCTTHNLLLDSSNVMETLSTYDIVVDATDNVATRYLLNDACVFQGKPLVSGSALRMDGQLTVYNHADGPCYRCIFPSPPPPETVTNCSDGGVLGVVPGLIGCMQALEVIKLISTGTTSYLQRMLLFDADAGTFRSIKLRGRNPNCVVCGETPTVTAPIDYVQFCGSGANDKDKGISILDPMHRVTPATYHHIVHTNTSHILVDVRNKTQFDICALPNTVHVPLARLEQAVTEIEECRNKVGKDAAIYVVCRRGNDSQIAVQKLRSHGLDNVFDIVGGLRGWSETVDRSFPIY